ATAATYALGSGAGKVITVAVLVSMFSAANGLVLTAPRVFFAMARDGVFFRKLALIHPTFGTPAIAVVATCLWAMLLAASGTFEQLLTYVVFTGWIFYALGAATIFVFRRRNPDAPRPFRVPGYPITPLLFVAASSAIVVNAVLTQTGRALLGVAVVLTGVPAYFVWQSRRPGAKPPAVPQGNRSPAGCSRAPNGEVVVKQARGTRTKRSAGTNHPEGPTTLVYERLRDLIVRGQLAPGARLIEQEIATRLGTSRTPVRSALQRLQQERYVTAPPGGKHARMTVAPLTMEDAQELFEIVGFVEAASARRAAMLPMAQRVKVATDIAEINAALQRATQVQRPDQNEVFDLDTAFHRGYVEAGAGPRLLAL